MMTALQIERHDSGFWRLLRHNRVRVEHRYCDSAAVRCVTYEQYRGKVSWTVIDRIVKAQRNRLLCSQTLALPRESGYKRFVSQELDRRMCENAALYLLREADCRGAKVVLIDDTGDSAGLCEYLADHCDPIYVVTEAKGIYAAQAEVLLNEKGAALRVCSGTDCLQDADLIIAPRQLTQTLPCSSSALILTGETPAAVQNTTAICEYYFDLPAKYKELCPSFLDEMYFASALFALTGARELGGEIFTRCGDGCIMHTRKSLISLFKKRMNCSITP